LRSPGGIVEVDRIETPDEDVRQGVDILGVDERGVVDGPVLHHVGDDGRDGVERIGGVAREVLAEARQGKPGAVID
jgi:hypothetical protein